MNLAHNLAETHITSIALQEFADRVEEKSNGRIQIKIFPNGTLGSETEVLEQLMAGVVDMTRVSAPGLATYNEGYHTFGLPYICLLYTSRLCLADLLYESLPAVSRHNAQRSKGWPFRIKNSAEDADIKQTAVFVAY